MFRRAPKIDQPVNSSEPINVKKRRKSKYYVLDIIWLENRGAHWPMFRENRAEKIEHLEKFDQKIESWSYSFCNTYQVFFAYEKEKMFLQYFMMCDIIGFSCSGYLNHGYTNSEMLIMYFLYLGGVKEIFAPLTLFRYQFYVYKHYMITLYFMIREMVSNCKRW